MRGGDRSSSIRSLALVLLLVQALARLELSFERGDPRASFIEQYIEFPLWPRRCRARRRACRRRKRPRIERGRHADRRANCCSYSSSRCPLNQNGLLLAFFFLRKACAFLHA